MTRPDESFVVQVSPAEIARDTDMSVFQVLRSLQELVDVRLIERLGGDAYLVHHFEHCPPWLAKGTVS